MKKNEIIRALTEKIIELGIERKEEAAITNSNMRYIIEDRDIARGGLEAANMKLSDKDQTIARLQARLQDCSSSILSDEGRFDPLRGGQQ